MKIINPFTTGTFFPPNIPFINILLVNILLVFYKVMLVIKFPYAFGFSIVLLTLFIRFLFNPFFHKQLELNKKMQDLKPHLDKLNQKHKNDQKKLQQEQLKLYQQAGINPSSGCLFTIVQMIVMVGLYNIVFFLFNPNINQTIAEINKIIYFNFLKISSLDPWFFGFNLGVAPSHYQKFGFYYLLIPLITGILQYWQFQVSIPTQSVVKTDSNKSKDEKEDFQKSMSVQMKFMFPALIGFFSYTMPVGLSLYWNIFSLFSIIQGRKINPKIKSSNDKSNPKTK